MGCGCGFDFIAEIELNLIVDTCEAKQFEQMRPEAEGGKILACPSLILPIFKDESALLSPWFLKKSSA